MEIEQTNYEKKHKSSCQIQLVAHLALWTGVLLISAKSSCSKTLVIPSFMLLVAMWPQVKTEGDSLESHVSERPVTWSVWKWQNLCDLLTSRASGLCGISQRAQKKRSQTFFSTRKGPNISERLGAPWALTQYYLLILWHPTENNDKFKVNHFYNLLHLYLFRTLMFALQPEVV